MSLIRDDSLLNEILKNPALEIEQVNKRSRAMASLIFGSREQIARIDGVNWQQEKELENLKLLEGSLENCRDARALILPASTAHRLGIQVGETLLVRLSTVTGQQNVGEFVLAGIMYDQGSFGFSAAYADLEYLNSLLGLSPGQYQLFHIYLKSMETMKAAADLIQRDLSLKAVTEPRGQLFQSSGSSSRVPLSGKEFDVLKYLVVNCGKALTPEVIYREVWGNKYGDLTTVAVYIQRIRRKIEQNPSNPRYLQTIHGKGYRFNPETLISAKEA